MRELRFNAELSTAEEIIVEFVAPDDSADGTATTANRMRLPVTSQLKALLIDENQASNSDSNSAETPDSENSESPESASGEDKPAEPAAAKQAAAEPQQPAPPAEPEKPAKPTIVLRPREIQDRVRAGASVDDLAAETGMAERKIEPFAHPVLLERARIAELGKDARPVRSDGPAELSLLEVLDTAFAARGNDISEATWDAWRDRTGQWIIAVHFEVGLSSSTAEWSFHPGGGRAATAVARNNIAADLIDPDFANPVRSLSAVGPMGSAASNHVAGQDAMPSAPTAQRRTPAGSHAPTQQGQGGRGQGPDTDRIVLDEKSGGHVGAGSQPSEEAPQNVDDAEADSFLQHPEEEQPRRRRRKTVLPSWDDVLLDVRPTGKK